jgi:K+-transporting ATPase KdpF subunit
MHDLIFLALTIVFFLLTLAYVRGCAKLQYEENAMNLEAIVGLVVSALLLVYLAYALLRPEKF